MPYWIFHFFFRYISLWKKFVSFRSVSFRFVRFCFVSFLFRFALYRYPFLIGLNRIFSTLPQSEYTSREVYSGLCLFLSIVYSVFQRCPTRDQRRDFISSRPIKLQKRWNFLKFQNFTKFQNISKFSYTISKCSKNFKIIK